jgi:hypothetical protein
MKKIITLLVILFASGQAAAQEVVGKVFFLSGKAYVERGSGRADLQLKAEVLKGDTVATARGSSMILLLSDGSLLKMKPDSKLQIVDLSPRNGRIRLIAGSLFSKVRKLLKDELFQIETPVAVVGVRGTEFFMAFGKKKKEGQDLWMCVHEGVVAVEAVKTGGQAAVREGEGIVVTADGRPTAPRRYKWTEKLNWNMDAEKGDVVDRTSLESAYGDLKKQNYD